MIQIHNVAGNRLPITKAAFSEALQAVEEIHAVTFDFVEAVIVDEPGIVEINETHLGKDYVTDIITFPYHEEDAERPEGTLYLCLPRILEQAVELGESKKKEFTRVFVHGLLHLIGMDDESEEMELNMRKAEDVILERLGYGNERS